MCKDLLILFVNGVQKKGDKIKKQREKSTVGKMTFHGHQNKQTNKTSKTESHVNQ